MSPAGTHERGNSQMRLKPSTAVSILLVLGLALFLLWPRIQEARKVRPHQRVLVVYGFSILGEGRFFLHLR